MDDRFFNHVEAFQRDFQSMDSTPWNIKFAEVRHLSIQISETGDMATAIYEEPFEMIIEVKVIPDFCEWPLPGERKTGNGKLCSALLPFRLSDKAK